MRAATGADLVIFDHELVARAGAQPRERARVQGARPHRADPRHLRAARAQPARASCRSSWRSSSTCRRGWARLDPPRAPERRHRRARTRRDAARDRPPADRQAGRAAAGPARAGRAPARGAAPRARRRASVRTVALVGYTNAGKSTLFNALTARRRLRRGPAVRDARHHARAASTSPGADAIVLSDTVGFIRDLPHDLVAGVPRHAGGDGARRPAAARGRRGRARARRAGRGGRTRCSPRSAPTRCRRSWSEQDRLVGLAPGVERDEYGRFARFA